MNKQDFIKEISDLVADMNKDQLSTTYDRVLEISKENIRVKYNKSMFNLIKNNLIDNHDMTVTDSHNAVIGVGHAIDNDITLQYDYENNVIEIVKNNNGTAEILLSVKENGLLLYVLDEANRWLNEMD